MMFWYGNGMNSLTGLLMAAAMILVCGLVILGTVVLIRHLAGPLRHLEPEQVLAARFARGDIDETEYRGGIATLRAHDNFAKTPAG